MGVTRWVNRQHTFALRIVINASRNNVNTQWHIFSHAILVLSSFFFFLFLFLFLQTQSASHHYKAVHFVSPVHRREQLRERGPTQGPYDSCRLISKEARSCCRSQLVSPPRAARGRLGPWPSAAATKACWHSLQGAVDRSEKHQMMRTQGPNIGHY